MGRFFSPAGSRDCPHCITDAVFLRGKSNARKDTIITGLLSGVFFTGAVLLYNTTLSRNVPLSIALPMLVGGIGVAGVIAGVVVFHESLSLMKLIGVSVKLVGTVVLAKG